MPCTIQFQKGLSVPADDSWPSVGLRLVSVAALAAYTLAHVLEWPALVGML